MKKPFATQFASACKAADRVMQRDETVVKRRGRACGKA